MTEFDDYISGRIAADSESATKAFEDAKDEILALRILTTAAAVAILRPVRRRSPAGFPRKSKCRPSSRDMAAAIPATDAQTRTRPRPEQSVQGFSSECLTPTNTDQPQGESDVKTSIVLAGVLCAVLLLSLLGMSGAAVAGPDGHGSAHSHDEDQRAYGQPGDPQKPAREIAITMKEGDGSMTFEPNLVDISKGEQIRFKLKNEGELDHEIVIATRKENLEHAKEMAKNPDMEHDDPNAKRLKPKAEGEILWRFTKAGEFDMSCLIPGHLEAGMTGKIIVK